MAKRLPATRIVITKLPEGKVAAFAHFGQLKPTLMSTCKANASQAVIDKFIRKYQLHAVNNFFDFLS